MALVLAEFSPGKFGQVDAVRSLLRLQTRCQAAVGSTFYIGPGQDFIRYYDAQVALLKANYTRASTGSVYWDGSWWRRRPGGVTAAQPGAGDHPKGTAADISFQTSAARSWFRANCGSENWSNDGDRFGEDWHKRFNGSTTGTAGGDFTPIPEEDMTPEQAQQLATAAAKVANIEAILATESDSWHTGGIKGAIRVLPALVANAVATVKVKRAGKEVTWLQDNANATTYSQQALDILLKGLTAKLTDQQIAQIREGIKDDPDQVAQAVLELVMPEFDEVDENLDRLANEFTVTLNPAQFDALQAKLGVDPVVFANAVDAVLADNFAAIPDAVADEQGKRLQGD